MPHINGPIAGPTFGMRGSWEHTGLRSSSMIVNGPMSEPMGAGGLISEPRRPMHLKNSNGMDEAANGAMSMNVDTSMDYSMSRSDGWPMNSKSPMTTNRGGK